MKPLKRRSLGIGGLLLILIASPAAAETWSQRYIESLPDTAFASVEITKEGKKIRHLPHHDQTGEIDMGHLKSALGRIRQVKWINPANFSKAKDHLEQHYKVYRQEQAKNPWVKDPKSINKAAVKE